MNFVFFLFRIHQFVLDFGLNLLKNVGHLSA